MVISDGIESDEYQADLLVDIMNFKKKTKPESPEKKTRKRNCSLKLA